jgi:hypothetical protein
LNRSIILIGFLILAFLFATFPGKGGLEGDQRSVALLSERSDNWGFLVPFLYGEWPDFFGHWRYSLVLLQLCALWFGLYFLMPKNMNHGLSNRLPYFLVVYISSVFASQLWRDASLFSFTVFGLGIAKIAMRSASPFKRMWLLPSIFCLFFAAMFKTLFGVIIGFFFMWLALQTLGRKKTVAILSVVVILLLGLAPFFIDKALGKYAGLKKNYPEQQPIIFDLASNYCWGSSDKIIYDAENGLKLVLKEGYPLESTCASLRPNSWDNLHSNPMKWEFSSPIFRISGENESKVRELQKKWLHMIIRNPVDWIQTRSIYLGPTLLMSNSFTEQAELAGKPGIFETVNYMSWKLISLPAFFLDKTRLTSLGFAMVFILFLILRNSYIRKKSAYLFNYFDLVVASLIISLTVCITIFFFTANNGRYVMPFVLLTYIFLLRSESLRSPIQVKESKLSRNFVR